MSSIVIRSGGQTGVDRAVLDFAVRFRLNYGGWSQRGSCAEDFLVPPDLLAIRPRPNRLPPPGATEMHWPP
ncbi:MAG TPA: putative molybdenum carrier protein [Pirellulales bacterium]|jgi:hypothetical protein|nr:putative molybdenum carrier protein [Pirellulales bacterium]